MTSLLDKNNQLLRAIMQKMEIRTEEEEWDEGVGVDSDDTDTDTRGPRTLVSRSNRDKTHIKRAVLSMWPKARNS